jgi:hypothetical protein
MNTQVRRKLDMAARVREFVRAHAATEPGYAPVLPRLEELLTQAEAIVAREAASEAARTARRDHIGARADLEVISAQLVEQVNLTDGITRYRFGNDAEVMAEWKAARQRLGQPRNGERVSPAAPPPAGEVKDAA